MVILTYGLIAACVLLACGPWGLKERDGNVNRRADAFLRQQGLPLSAGLHQDLRARLRRHERASQLWGWGGWVLGVGLAAIAALLDAERVIALLIFSATGLGYAIGASISASQSAAALAPEAPRVARLRAMTWTDYCTRWERWAALAAAIGVMLACSTTTAVWVMVPVRPAGGWLVPAAVILLGLCIVAAMAALVRTAGAVADRPQRARTRLELAWDDALRSRAVRGLLTVIVVMGLEASLLILATSAMWVLTAEHRVRATLTAVAFAAGLVCWAGILVPWICGRYPRNPSLALWRGQDLAEPHAGGSSC